MFDLILKDFLLDPLTQLFAGLYTAIQLFVPNYGISIIFLSIITAIIMIPLERKVRGSVLKEKEIENVLTPQILDIKKNYKGAERTLAIKRLYSRYSYSPFYAIRNIYSLLLQLPFLFGAYLMLSENKDIQGVSFLFLKDLGSEDKILAGLNLLPFLMTAINLSTLYFLKLSKKENIQTLVIALFFCVVLYNAPSALLIYWTMNNVIHLIRAIYKSSFKKTSKIAFDYSLVKIKLLMEVILSLKLFKVIKKVSVDRIENEFFKNSWKYFVYLILITPIVIISFNNIGYYTLDKIFRSLFILTLVALAIILLLSITKKFIQNNHQIRIVFIYGVLFAGGAYFYKLVGYNLLDLHKGQKILLHCLIFISIFYIGKFKLFNQLVGLFIIIFSCVGIYKNHVASNEFLTGVKNYSIQLNSKPNIYYILCESMNSTDIAVKTYDLQIDEKVKFENHLKNLNFTVPDYVYANGYHTLMTLQTVFLMKNFVGDQVGNFDAASSIRSMITGDNNNTLLKILKDNGYHTTLALGAEYFGTIQGQLLDFYDSTSGNKGIEPLVDGYAHYEKLQNKLKKIGNKSFSYKEPSNFFKDYFDDEPNGPHFLFYRLAHTNHTPSGIGELSKAQSEEWRNSGWYKNAYKKEMHELMKITDMILDHDPDAIIILCGDHGAWLYRYSPYYLDAYKKYLSELNISHEDFINDKYKVFAAVRLPNKYGKIEDLWSPANIFAKIFTKIGYEGDRLNISNNLSFYFPDKENPFVKEGKVVELEELSECFQ